MIAKALLFILVGVAVGSPLPAGYDAPHAPHYGPRTPHHGPHTPYHGPHSPHHGPIGGGYAHRAPAKYEFSYGVNDPHYGANFGHSESRDGYHAKGEYYVHLPDGRLQRVSYFTDEWGYHPTVTYVGEAKFPSKGYHGHGGGYH